MKKLFLLFLFVTFVSVNAKAQHPAGERMRSLEIGYLTKELKLTPEEAEKFWPVYNKYRAELRALPHSEDELERQQQVLNIRKNYRPKFSTILDDKRAQTVYDAEDRLRIMVKKELERRKSRQKPRSGNK